MPELFPDTTAFVLCSLVVAGAQLIYATVGFGAGMFAMALLALLLPDLAGAVATFMVLSLVTEVWVLRHSWRHARPWLLAGLMPSMVIGLVIGAKLLAGGDVLWLKRVLGVVVLGAGLWFLREERVRRAAQESPPPAERGQDRAARPAKSWLSVPAGLASGTLAGLFGTGGPPVIVFLHGHGLDKSAFRATLLWCFLLMGGIRSGVYAYEGLLGMGELRAALWLLPATVAGAALGMAAHHRISERRFAVAVSVLLIFLGFMLLVGSRR